MNVGRKYWTLENKTERPYEECNAILEIPLKVLSDELCKVISYRVVYKAVIVVGLSNLPLILSQFSFSLIYGANVNSNRSLVLLFWYQDKTKKPSKSKLNI